VRPLKIAVLGVGLIGGSIGLAARTRAGARVSGWDPDRDASAAALALGAIDAAADDIAGAVAGADVVFVAAPVGALVDTVRAALGSAGAETIVTDVGSTKRVLAAAIADPRFVAGHPLAGSEVSGVRHARADLFEGAVWYLSVSAAADTPPGAPYEPLRRLIERFGARPVPIDADTHDRLMATVSQLPHVLANLLVAQATAALATEGVDDADGADGAQAPGMTAPRPGRHPLGVGPSFRDATRVAGSNSAVWTDIYMSNRDALVTAIDDLTGRLAHVRAALETGDADALTAWNERARAERETLARSGS
jgi:prephenate dehydrogenase